MKYFIIFNFNSSFLFFIFSIILFNSRSDSSTGFSDSSKIFIFFDKITFLSFCIFSIRQILQSLCWPFPLYSILVIQSEQHSWLWFLQYNSNLLRWFSSLQKPVNIYEKSLFISTILWPLENNSLWKISHLLHIFLLHWWQKNIASLLLCFIEEHFILLIDSIFYKKIYLYIFIKFFFLL